MGSGESFSMPCDRNEKERWTIISRKIEKEAQLPYNLFKEKEVYAFFSTIHNFFYSLYI
jgi:hypothetical protein